MPGLALVTGATGFVGGVLCRRLLERGHPVRAAVQRPDAVLAAGVDRVVCDIREGVPAVALVGVESLYHLAARVHSPDLDDDAEHTATTAIGTSRLVAQAAAAGVRALVLFSTVAVTPAVGDVCLDETAEPMPATAYGRAKLAAEQAVLAAPPAMRTACLRLPMVYGPGQKGNLPRLLAAIDRGWLPPLPDWGNGRSLIHVEDAVDAAIALASALLEGRSDRRIYIAAEPRAYSSHELYTLLAAGLGRRAPAWTIPRAVLSAAAWAGDLGARLTARRMPFDTAALDRLRASACYSPELIRRDLGFSTRHSFPASIEELVADYRASRRAHTG